MEPEHLLERLVLDQKRPQVTKRLTNLLLNSYFPRGVSVSKLLNRCVSFIQRSPKAAEVFYKHAHLHVGTGAVVKLVSVLFKGLQSAMKHEDEGTGTLASMDEEEVEEDNDGNNLKKTMIYICIYLCLWFCVVC